MPDFGHDLFPYYSRRREFVRAPTGTPSERTHKEHLGRSLKIETMFSYAAIGKALDQALTSNWRLSPTQLESRVASFLPRVPDQDVVSRVIDHIHALEDQHILLLAGFRERAGLPKPLWDYRRWSSSEKEAVGRQIYFELTGKIPRQDGQIEMLTNPLTVGINVPNAQDYQILDNETNSGGYFDPDAITHNQPDHPFPLIVTHASSDLARKHIEAHELGHAIHHSLWQSLPDRLDLVGGYASLDIPTIPYSTLENRRKRRQAFQAPSPPNRWMLARAKDEILADHYASGNFDYANSVLEEDGLYNYPRKIADHHYSGKTDTSTKLHAQVYREAHTVFEDSVTAAHTAAKNLADLYQKQGLIQRAELLPWVLRQTPLSRWETVCQFLTEEVTALDTRRQDLRQLLELASHASSQLHWRHHERVMRARRHLPKMLEDEDATSVLVALHTQVHQLIAKIGQETATSQHQSLYRLLPAWDLSVDRLLLDLEKVYMSRQLSTSFGLDPAKIRQERAQRR